MSPRRIERIESYSFALVELQPANGNPDAPACLLVLVDDEDPESSKHQLEIEFTVAGKAALMKKLAGGLEIQSADQLPTSS